MSDGAAAASIASAAARQTDRAFLGHPRGLGILTFAELCERFSYVGMQTLLVLYATHWLFLPGHIEKVWGFAGFRAALESVYGPLSPQALASNIYGLYTGIVYLTPIAGGLLADRLIGKTRTITIGAILMACGHGLMAFEQTFLPALLCLILGVSCFKANISGQVGDLYAPGDLRRARAFQIFILGIQIAALISPLVCGTLGEKVGWHWGFLAAGIGMLVGLAIYLAGRRWLPPEPAPVQAHGIVEPRPRLAPGDGKTIAVLLLLVPVLALSQVGNQQIFNAYLLWGEANYHLIFFGRTMPVTWLISLDALISSAMLVLSIGFWRWWATRWKEPDEIGKLILGMIFAAAAPFVLAIASLHPAGGHHVSLGWGLAFHILNEIGFVHIYPVGLALYSRAAPKAVGGTMVAAYFLHLFIANLTVGWLGGLLGTMSGASFWLLHAGLVTLAAVIFLAVGRLAGRALTPAA